jgi:hypothetical protein
LLLPQQVFLMPSASVSLLAWHNYTLKNAIFRSLWTRGQPLPWLVAGVAERSLNYVERVACFQRIIWGLALFFLYFRLKSASASRAKRSNHRNAQLEISTNVICWQVLLNTRYLARKSSFCFRILGGTFL